MVVLPSQSHRHIPRGNEPMRIMRKNGNATIIINTSYLDNLTEEQAKLDDERIHEAAWAIIDELIEWGEEV